MRPDGERLRAGERAHAALTKRARACRTLRYLAARVGRRRKKKQRAASTPALARVLHLRLRRVELARGYDGPLRGAPEPALVFGVYRVTEHEGTLVSRSVVRLQSRGSYPELLDAGDVDVGARIPRLEGMRVLVLAAAIEEDAGRGIERLYADLEAPAQLAAWSVDAQEPEPIPLLEWARSAPPSPPATARVHLVDPGGDLRDRRLGDDWIGAALFHLDERTASRAERRMRFVSEDGRNDWTAVLDVRLV